MDNDVMNEILFNIQNELEENVDERQLFNMIKEQADYYQLNAYGVILKFNKDDGSLIEND
jgi:hypothetical protein